MPAPYDHQDIVISTGRMNQSATYSVRFTTTPPHENHPALIRVSSTEHGPWTHEVVLFDQAPCEIARVWWRITSKQRSTSTTMDQVPSDSGAAGHRPRDPGPPDYESNLFGAELHVEFGQSDTDPHVWEIDSSSVGGTRHDRWTLRNGRQVVYEADLKISVAVT